MEAGEKAPAVWPGRDKQSRRQTKPVPSRRSPATTRGSSSCHAASCPLLCPRGCARQPHGRVHRLQMPVTSTALCSGCGALADTWAGPESSGGRKKVSAAPRCPRLSLTGLEHPQVPTAPSNKGGQSPSPPCPLGAVPRGSGRAAAGDLGLLPQGGGHQEPRGHFLDRGASECFNSRIDTFPFTKPFCLENFRQKKKT